MICFVFMFSYLLFFRMTKYVDIPAPPGHTNLVQMMLVLKVRRTDAQSSLLLSLPTCCESNSSKAHCD